MSSRSLAAARARRAGENVPPVSGNRPVTSIGSLAQQMPPPSSNVRVARSMQQPSHPSNHRPAPPQHQQNNYYDAQSHSSNGLPFSKLSVSDAIGLITLRLGRVEQWIIDTDHEEQVNGKSSGPSIPDNHKIIDSSVLTTIINRLDSLEKNAKNAEGQTQNGVNTEEFTKLTEEVKKLTEQITRVGDDVVKHTLEIAKSNEQIFRFNRDLTETKDILKTFMLKYDLFAEEIMQNFSDYEDAFADIEKRMQGEVPSQEVQQVGDNLTAEAETTEVTDEISSSDLKSIIKQELANG